MLKRRIVPCLDVRDGRVVKGVNFEGLRDAGDPAELGRLYARQGADELVFLDITATRRAERTAIHLAENVARELFIPFTIGGGLRSVVQMRDVLHAGADKIGINTAAAERPELVSEAAERFGSQAVVVAIDAHRVAPAAEPAGEVVELSLEIAALGPEIRTCIGYGFQVLAEFRDDWLDQRTGRVGGRFAEVAVVAVQRVDPVL